MGTRADSGVEQVDQDFKPGKKANADIAAHMGYEGDFCEDESAVTTVLEDMQILDAMFQLQDESGGYFCVFEQYGDLFTTRSYKKQVHSLAAVAHYLVTK